MKNRKQFPEKERYSAFNIHMRLGNSIKLVPRLAQLQVARCLSFLPREVVDFIIDNYVFIGQDEDELGSQFQFDHPFFSGKKIGFILLSSQLWKRRPIEKAMVIVHEVAHAVNKFKSRRYEGNVIERKLARENEANKLAVTWLSKRYKRKSLLGIRGY